MLVRVSLSKRISLEEFKKQFGEHYANDVKLLKAYEAAVAKFPKEEPVKEKVSKS